MQEKGYKEMTHKKRWEEMMKWLDEAAQDTARYSHTLKTLEETRKNIQSVQDKKVDHLLSQLDV